MFSKDATMNSLKQKALYKIRSEHESPDDSFKIPVLQEEDDFEDIEKVYLKNVLMQQELWVLVPKAGFPLTRIGLDFDPIHSDPILSTRK